MRKSLLMVAAAALLVAVPASALTRQSRMVTAANQSMMLNAPEHLDYGVAMPASRSEMLTMDWGYCDAPYTAYSVTGDFKGAFMMSADDATKFAGAKITAIQVANPTYNDGNYTLPFNDVTVWLSEDLNKEPFKSVAGKLVGKGFQYSSIALDEPYVIQANKPVYIGFTFPKIPEATSSADRVFSLVVDAMYPLNDHSCYIYSNFLGFDNQSNMQYGDVEWRNQGKVVGSICITARLEGENLPRNQVAFMDYIIPGAVAYNKPFTFDFYLYNNGANKINNVELTFTPEGGTPVTAEYKLTYEIGYHQSEIADVQFTCDVEGNNIPYTVAVTKINGEEVTDGYKLEGTIRCLEKGYKQNIVIEECTGTWCGYCVRGIAGMEYMAEHYTDQGFIGIGVHQGDRMATMDGGSYTFLKDYVSGFPSAFVNRDMNFTIDPSPEEMEYYFKEWSEIPAYAEIEASLVADPDNAKKVTLKTSTKFVAAEENAKYLVGYTVVEDGVGPYNQSNYFSGMADSESYGFGSQPNPVSVVYNDVALNCSKPEGIEGSLPTSFEKETAIDFETEITLNDVENLKHYRVVAMVVNTLNKRIENAVIVMPEDYEAPVNAISGVVAENNAPVVYYNLQGMRVNNPQGGVFIRVQGNEVSKVLVK